MFRRGQPAADGRVGRPWRSYYLELLRNRSYPISTKAIKDVAVGDVLEGSGSQGAGSNDSIRRLQPGLSHLEI